jgi:hypothetical protein
MDDIVALIIIIVTIYIPIYIYKKVMKIAKKREEVLEKENFTDNFKCSIHAYKYFAFRNNSFYLVDFVEFYNDKPIITEIEKIKMESNGCIIKFKNKDIGGCIIDNDKSNDFKFWYNDRKTKENTNQS